MQDKIKNTLIGVFVVVAIFFIVSMVLFLKPTVGDGERVYQVRFSNISGIGKGTRVTFAGRAVGEVSKVEEVPGARQGPVDELGRTYFYQLTLKVDSSVKIYNTDEIALQTSGLLGEKSVAIVPKKAPKGITAKLITTQVMYADSIDPIENAINEVAELSSKVEAAITDFNEWFLGNEKDMSIAIRSFSTTMQKMTTTLDNIENEQVVEKIAKATDFLTDNLRITYGQLKIIEENHTTQKFDDAVDHFASVAKAFDLDGRQILCHLNLITSDLADGTGTLGKLITNDDFYLRLTSLMGKAETVFNDVNHYGLLFQYDKSWQRQRTKRANLLRTLSTPKEFRGYFEDELCSIQTSLTRVSALLDKANCPSEKTKIISCKSFQKDFALLLSQVNALSGDIKTYNEELIEKINQQEDAICK